MKFFVCKNCGFLGETSGDVWIVKRNSNDDAEIVCPKCNQKEFLKLKIDVE